MKVRITLLLLFVSLFMQQNLVAQALTESQVPSQVRSYFTSKSGKSSASWRKGENGTYDARFSESGGEMIWNIHPKPALVAKKLIIQYTEIPAAAKNYIGKNFAGYTPSLHFKVIDYKGRKYFESELSGATDMVVVKFTLDGNFLHQTKKPLENPIVSNQNQKTDPNTNTNPVKTEPPQNTTTGQTENNNTETEDLDEDLILNFDDDIDIDDEMLMMDDDLGEDFDIDEIDLDDLEDEFEDDLLDFD